MVTGGKLNSGLQIAIKRLREQTGIGVVEFCKVVGINGVCEYEKGRRSVTIRVLNQYARYFNMKVSDIVKMGEDLYAETIQHNEK